jgi:hypothetical protein
VQTSAAKQPKIVSGGSLVTGGALNEPSISFGTSADKYLDVAGRPVTKSVFSSLEGGDTNYECLITDTNNNSPRITTNNAANNRVYSFDGFGTPSVNINGSTYNGTSAAGSFNFHLLSMTSATGESIDRIGANAATGVTANSFNFVSELILYPDDQTDNRTALEANIGEVYGIAGIPAYDNTVNGFVETWYDHSGNGNNASQLTAGKQPKIVDGGSLVAGGIDFDGVNDSFSSIPNLFSGTSAASSFIVGNADSTGVSEPMFAQGDNAIVGNAFVITSEIAFRPGGNTIYDDTFIDANSLLLSTIVPASSTSADALMFLDGGALGQTSTTSATLNYGNQGAFIGSTFSASAFYDGRLSEIIIYNSDQTANRLAIEANINNQYDIY